MLYELHLTDVLCRCAGDLGAIDRKFDVAASTACPALDYIVVETTVDAQQCVELLRRQKLGVATFLILEKQRGLAGRMQEKVQPPEGKLHRLRDPWAPGARIWRRAVRGCLVARLGKR